MSSYIISLQLAVKDLYQIGGLFMMIVGSVISILNLLTFTRKNLRKNPCTIYFIAFNFSNLLFICLPLLFAILALGYDIQPSASSLVSCRFNVYTAFLFLILSPFYLILASIDRIFITSRKVHIRQRSTCRLAYTCIISGTLFWMLFHSHALVFTNIVQVAPNRISCYFQSGPYSLFVGFYSVIIVGIVVPLLLIIFGLLALKNIRSLRRVQVVPVILINRMLIAGNLRVIPPKDRQLILMLLMNIIIYIVFNSMLVTFVMCQQITQYQRKSVEQIQFELVLRNIATIIGYVPFSISGFTNLFVSKKFRKEVKNVLLCR